MLWAVDHDGIVRCVTHFNVLNIGQQSAVDALPAVQECDARADATRQQELGQKSTCDTGCFKIICMKKNKLKDGCAC